jgi:ribosomal-protein-alanine N-acetyltransferase
LQQQFRVRKFKPEDLQSVIKINRVCLPENYIDSFFMDLHHRFPDTFIVAEEDGDVVGYIMCRIEVGLSNYGLGGVVKKGHVVSIAVTPDHRKGGIGKALMLTGMEGMRGYNAKQCYLEVRVTNEAAVNLYKKLGFEVTKTLRGYYADGEDAHVMTKKL